MTDAGHVSRRSVLYGSALATAVVGLAACSSKSTKGSAPDSSTSESTRATSAGTAPGKAPSGKNRGSSAAALPKPASFAESPMTAALVRSGKLAPVESRLPDEPYVVPHK